MLRSRVVRAERVYGGYGPSATYRMRLLNDRRAFFKGVHAGSNEFMRRAFVQEEKVYRRAAPLLGRFAPRFFGSVHLRDWHVLLLEDVGPRDVPPWNLSLTRHVARELARFHASTVGRSLPRWLPKVEWRAFAEYWDRFVERETEVLPPLVALTGAAAPEASAWLHRNAGQLAAASRPLRDARGPFSLLHLDTRSDNLRARSLGGGGLKLFDWNWASVGPGEFDLTALAESIGAEGGPEPEEAVRAYDALRPIRQELVTSIAAGFAGFFALVCWRDPTEGLPRLRSIQRRQFKASLRWAASRLALPEPGWVDAVPD